MLTSQCRRISALGSNITLSLACFLLNVNAFAENTNISEILEVKFDREKYRLPPKKVFDNLYFLGIETNLS